MSKQKADLSEPSKVQAEQSEAEKKAAETARKKKYRQEIGGDPIVLMRLNRSLVVRLRRIVGDGDVPGKKTDTKIVHKILHDFVSNSEKGTQDSSGSFVMPPGCAIVKMSDVLALDEGMRGEIKFFTNGSWQEEAQVMLRERIDEKMFSLDNP